MFRNYLRFTWRNLTRNKAYALLNISGLAIALGACMVIFLVLQREYSYDGYHKNAPRIYQMVKNMKNQDGEHYEVSIPFAAIRALRVEYPGITFAELMTSYGSQVTLMDKDGAATSRKFIEDKGVFYAEPQLFDLFDVKWLSGSQALLNDPNTTVLSRSVAEKYFGSWQNSIGRAIKLDNNIDARVAGVIEDVPANTDFPFRLIVSYKTFLNNHALFGYTSLDGFGWGVSSHQVYALLPENVQPGHVDQLLVGFLQKYGMHDPMIKESYLLQPLKNIHFDERYENDGDHISSRASLYTLMCIGVLIILMACINFVNLSTALAVKRSREVGIRRVMGGRRSQLRWQILFETATIVSVSIAIAIILAWSSLPFIRYIVVVQDKLNLFNTGSILFIVATGIVTTFLSGFYPAVVLSNFRPVEAIKNKISTTQVAGISLRRVLVVLQFAFSQVLIVATIIIVSQMNYVRHADLGFNKEAVLLLHGNSDSLSLSRQAAFKAALLRLPDVKAVSFSFDAPSAGGTWNNDFSFNHSATNEPFNAALKFADADYAKTYGLQLVAGRYYSANDSAYEAVINETLARKLGLKTPQDAVGKTLSTNSPQWRLIVGVVKDFKNNSLKQAIQPTILFRYPRFYSLTAVKLNSRNLGKSDATVAELWNRYFPEYAYNSEFMDDNINHFYDQERRLSNMYKVYAALAIFISCLGLYGLISFMAVQKTKEVGIRKVLGATAGHIVYLFSKEFTVLILIAFAIAAPVAYLLMNSWLKNFVYRVDVGAGIFVLAMVVSVVIAWITVGYKSIKAALANPVHNLRTE